MKTALSSIIFVGFALTLTSCHHDEASAPSPTEKQEAASGMEYVEICNKALQCKNFSRLVMGTDHLVQDNWVAKGQPAPTDEAAYAVLDEAAKLGINFFDTSPIYVGDVERKLGQWKKSRDAKVVSDTFYAEPKLNPDRKLYVLSKGGFPFDLFWAKRLSAGTHSRELVKELERQNLLTPGTLVERGETPLKNVPAGSYASRLYGERWQIRDRVSEELDHTVKNLMGDVTIYLMHRDDGDAIGFEPVKRPQTSVEDILLALDEAQIRDRVWMLGWSNWETERVDKSINLTWADRTLPKPVINSPYFSLFEMSQRSIHALGVQVTHAEMMNPHFQKGIKIMPYSPLGGFSILDKPAPQWENAKKAAKEKADQGDPYWRNVYPSIFTAANEARWHRAVEFTKTFNTKNQTNYTIDQMINAYALAHPRTDLLAIGAITAEQVRRTVGALTLSKKLTPADLEYLHSGAR